MRSHIRLALLPCNQQPPSTDKTVCVSAAAATQTAAAPIVSDVRATVSVLLRCACRCRVVVVALWVPLNVCAYANVHLMSSLSSSSSSGIGNRTVAYKLYYISSNVVVSNWRVHAYDVMPLATLSMRAVPIAINRTMISARVSVSVCMLLLLLRLFSSLIICVGKVDQFCLFVLFYNLYFLKCFFLCAIVPKHAKTCANTKS